jgi:hypothetical protein
MSERRKNSLKLLQIKVHKKEAYRISATILRERKINISYLSREPVTDNPHLDDKNDCT